MQPCPSRAAEFNRFMRSGDMSIEYRCHHETCGRCQAAMVSDPRLDALIASAAKAFDYPQKPNEWRDDPEESE